MVGLGVIGSVAAEDFLKNGHELYAWSRHPKKNTGGLFYG